jgi:hypothetical protein
LIFVICLLVATLLIGLGTGRVIKFKQRDSSSNPVNRTASTVQVRASSLVLDIPLRLCGPSASDSAMASYLPVFTNSNISLVRRSSPVLIEYTSDI